MNTKTMGEYIEATPGRLVIEIEEDRWAVIEDATNHFAHLRGKIDSHGDWVGITAVGTPIYCRRVEEEEYRVLHRDWLTETKYYPCESGTPRATQFDGIHYVLIN